MKISELYTHAFNGQPYTWGDRDTFVTKEKFTASTPGSTITFPIHNGNKENKVFDESIKVDTIEARDGAAAKVQTWVDGRSFTATGASKRNKGEPFVAGVGSRLALSRALENLAREIRKGIK